MAEAAVEAQCAIIGNVGFLGIPDAGPVVGGQGAIGAVLLVLATDLIVFGSLIVILITASRGRMSPAIFGTVGLGLLKNPMIMSIAAGLIWSAFALPIPAPVNDFLQILGAAATPGALFAIGASLAGKSAERLSVAAWLSFCKLVLHPAAVAAVGARDLFGRSRAGGSDDRRRGLACRGQRVHPCPALRRRPPAGIGGDPDLDHHVGR